MIKHTRTNAVNLKFESQKSIGKKFTFLLPSGPPKIDEFEAYLATTFEGRVEYELIYSPRSATHQVDNQVYIL